MVGIAARILSQLRSIATALSQLRSIATALSQLRSIATALSQLRSSAGSLGRLNYDTATRCPREMAGEGRARLPALLRSWERRGGVEHGPNH